MLVLRDGHPHGAEVVDAARRAAAVEDPRLVQVVDAGLEPIAYVVTERLVGRDLAQLAASGPLPAETVRRLVGEAALALDRISQRGLHHLRLGPRSIAVLADGSLRVVGTAVQAAAAGVEFSDAEAASRTDAVGLVRVLYAGLTGLWPGQSTAGMDLAPRVGGRPVSPGEIVGGVPDDLVTLCAATLGADEGPRTPAEVALRLAPWAGASPLRSSRSLDSIGPARPGVPPKPEPTKTEPEPTADSPEPGRPEDPPATDEPPKEPPTKVVPSKVAVAATSASTTIAMTARVQKTAPAIPTAPVAPGAEMAGPGTLSKLPLQSPLDWTSSWPEEHFADEGPEPLGHVLPAEPPPERDQSRLVLGVIGVLLLVFFLFAINSVLDLGRSSAALFGDDTNRIVLPTRTAAPRGTTAASGESASPSASATTKASGARPELGGVQAIDPLGDGKEKGELAKLAIDGKKKTSWLSSTYGSENFGGLKDGLGLVLELKDAATVKEVVVHVGGSGGKVELRSAKDPVYEGSDVLTSASIEDGEAKLTVDSPKSSRYYVLWFTQLPRLNGEYLLDVSEIEVR